MRSTPSRELYTTSVTVAEILYGIQRLPAGRRRDSFRDAALEIFGSFRDRVLAFDEDAAMRYAQIVDARERSGRPIDGFDAQIAAICRVSGATLATGNLKDFLHVGVELVDPWEEIKGSEVSDG